MIRGEAIVPLSRIEHLKARKIGLRRNRPKSLQGVTSHKSSQHLSDKQIHIVGATGEFAVAKYFGGKMDTDYSAGGDSWDVELPCGCPIGVRTRNGDIRNPDMAILSNSKPKKKRKLLDTVCCVLRDGSVELMGLWRVGSPTGVFNFHPSQGKRGERKVVHFRALDSLEFVWEHIEVCPR